MPFADFDGLTLSELNIALKAYDIIQTQRKAVLDAKEELLDLHLARLEVLINGTGKMEFEDEFCKVEKLVLTQGNRELFEEAKNEKATLNKYPKKALEFDALTTKMAQDILKRKRGENGKS